jgi:hypothetical protein
VTHSQAALGARRASEGQRDPPNQDDPPRRLVKHEPHPPPHHLYDDSDRPDAESLQRRSSKVRSTPPASAPGAPQGADTSVPPRRLQSLII